MNASRMDQSMQQKMVAGAAMQQAMRILQANTMELQQLISQALQSNPTLEARDPAPLSEHDAAEGDEQHADGQQWLNQISREPSLHEHLREQILQENLSDERREACLTLLDSLDERGYLDEDLGELATYTGIDQSVYERALDFIQQLDPAGVGARDLRECLSLQLRQLGEGDSLASELITQHWDALVGHHYALIATQRGLDVTLVEQAAARIARLQPYPGSNFARLDETLILPDVEVIENEHGELLVALTGEDVPQLAINADYRSMMAEHASNRELREYLSRCFREARDLISAIEQRQASILHIARAIVVRQEPFFRQGTRALKPLKMEQIAADTQLHLSTVSRAVRGKYLRCAQGLFELRHFFQRAASTGVQEESSTTVQHVYDLLRQWISDEDKSAPLSDSALTSLLADEGITLSRRTVAKYRDQLHIPPATQRR